MPNAGSFYASIVLEASHTYTFSFASDRVSIRLFAADGETECELTDGVIACTATGTYYVVITTTAAVSCAVRVDEAHECTSSATAVQYYAEGRVLYSYKTCDLCEIGKVEVTVVEDVIVVTNRQQAQEALDNATEGTWIWMQPANYGTLYIRQSALSTEVNIGDGWAGGGNYDRFREFKNVRITGAEGAALNRIVVEALLYTATGNQHSNSATMPYLRSLIAIENVVVEGLSFTLSSNMNAFDFAYGNVSVKGLTIDNCTFETTLNAVNTRVLYYGDYAQEIRDAEGEVIIDGVIRDITRTNSTTHGLHQVMELRDVVNVTVSGNTFVNSIAHDLLLNGEIAGAVVITDNTSEGCGDRFLRMNTSVNATLTMTGNTVTDCALKDGSAVKVTTTATFTSTISGNTWNGTADADLADTGLVDVPAPAPAPEPEPEPEPELV